ncbi:chaplin family protein [Streptomyces sp. NPDC001123]
MRQTLSRGMLAAAAATSILSLYGSPALAGTNPTGTAAGSPGAVSGGGVQTPASAPADHCADPAGTAAASQPAAGTSCANGGGADEHTRDRAREGSGHGSEGNRGGETGTTPPPDNRETPRAYGDDTPPAYGDDDAPPAYGGDTPPAYGGDTPPAYGEDTPPPPTSPPATTTPPTSPPPTTRPPTSPPPSRTPPHGGQHHGTPPTLPHTGSTAMLATSAASAVLVAGGAVLYRRGRAASRRP